MFLSYLTGGLGFFDLADGKIKEISIGLGRFYEY